MEQQLKQWNLAEYSPLFVRAGYRLLIDLLHLDERDVRCGRGARRVSEGSGRPFGKGLDPGVPSAAHEEPCTFAYLNRRSMAGSALLLFSMASCEEG